MKKRIITLVSALCLVISSYAVTYKEDKTICEGTSFPTFTASAGSSHQWYRNNVIINGATNQSYTPTQDGEYKCVITTTTDMNTGNLVSEGSFDKNCNNYPNRQSVLNEETGDFIQYELMNKECKTDPDEYPTSNFTSIAATPKEVKPKYFKNIRSVDGTDSNMLVCDGAESDGVKVWYARELKIVPGETYRFSCYVANIDSFYRDHGANSLSNLEFRIEYDGYWGDGKQLAQFKTEPIVNHTDLAKWVFHTATFTFPATLQNTTAHIFIWNHNTEGEGNDFAIDEIYFGTTLSNESSKDEYFKVTVDKKYNAVLNDESLCPGTNTQVSVGFVTDNNMAMMPPANAQYTWLWSDPNAGPQTASSESLTVTPNSTPGQTKTYNVEVKYSEACNKATASMVVTTRTDCGNTTENTYTYQVCNNSPYTLFAIHPSGNPTWDNGETGDIRIISSVPANTTTTYTCTIVDGADTYIEYHKVTGGDCSSTHNENACLGETKTLTPTEQGSGLTHCIWTLPDGTTQSGASLQVTPTEVGVKPYTCTVYQDPPTGGNLPAVIIAEETFNVSATDCHSTTEHPEVTLCLGQEVTLTPTFVADDYEWTLPDGTTLRAPSITASYDEATTKVFKCTAIKRANTEGAPILLYNMLDNGDFEDIQYETSLLEDGTILVTYHGFTSDYDCNVENEPIFPGKSQGQPHSGAYFLTNQGKLNSITHPDYITPGPDGGQYFMECDGGEVSTGAYMATLIAPIVQGKEYQFAYSACSHADDNYAKIRFTIEYNGNEIDLISTQTINQAAWTQYGAGIYWVAPENCEQAFIRLYNECTDPIGNDFALDNIMFQEVCRNANTEEIILHEETFTYTWGDCTTEEYWEVEFLKDTETTILTHKTGDSYKWLDQDGNELLDENGQPITSRSLNIVADKTQKYTCEIDLGGGAKHYEYITINFYLPTSLSRCENQTAVLTPSKQGTYAWYLLNEDGSKKPISEPIIKNKTVYCEYLTPNATNRILCTITLDQGTRDEQWNITVHANPSFDVEVEGRDVTIKTDDTFTTLVLDEQTTYEQTWITMLSVGEHSLTMTNVHGCQSTRTFEVVPIPLEPMVFFSPNQDGNFDNWEVKGIEFYLEATIQIYDRYHRLLATIQGEELIKGWDGNYNGHAMPMDDYWYIIMIPETKQQISGHFVLKR